LYHCLPELAVVQKMSQTHRWSVAETNTQVSDYNEDVVITNEELEALASELLPSINSFNQRNNNVYETLGNESALKTTLMFCRDQIEMVGSNNFEGDRLARLLNTTGQIAAVDISENGKLSSYWYDLQKTKEYKETFSTAVAMPIEKAYEDGNYESLVADVKAYVVAGDFTNPVLNMKVSFLKEIISRDSRVSEDLKLQIEELEQKVLNNIYLSKEYQYPFSYQRYEYYWCFLVGVLYHTFSFLLNPITF